MHERVSAMEGAQTLGVSASEASGVWEIEPFFKTIVKPEDIDKWDPKTKMLVLAYICDDCIVTLKMTLEKTRDHWDVYWSGKAAHDVYLMEIKVTERGYKNSVAATYAVTEYDIGKVIHVILEWQHADINEIASRLLKYTRVEKLRGRKDLVKEKLFEAVPKLKEVMNSDVWIALPDPTDKMYKFDLHLIYYQKEGYKIDLALRLNIPYGHGPRQAIYGTPMPGTAHGMMATIYKNGNVYKESMLYAVNGREILDAVTAIQNNLKYDITSMFVQLRILH